MYIYTLAKHKTVLLFVIRVSSIFNYLIQNLFLFSGNYILNYLATRPKLPNFVIQALVTLFARISKLGWFDSDKDEYVFRNVISDVTKFLQVHFFFLSKSNLSSSSYKGLHLVLVWRMLLRKFSSKDIIKCIEYLAVFNTFTA